MSCVDHWASKKEGAIDDKTLMAGPPPGMLDKEHMEHMAKVTLRSPSRACWTINKFKDNKLS